MKIGTVYWRKMRAFIIGGMVILITGCIPYHKIVKKEFPQGENTEKKNRLLNYVKTIRLYAGLSTLLELNALWLSNEIRHEYVMKYCTRRGEGTAFKNDMLRKELAENKKWITFCVLISTSSSETSALSDKNPFWTLCLQLPSGETIVPESIKEAELDPELISFFGDIYTHFKRPFLVRFPLPKTKFNSMSLLIESVRRKTYVYWDIPSVFFAKPQKQESYYEDFYWV